jgi:protein-S-isoprenylcysteine O-methyltransferase Ste14
MLLFLKNTFFAVVVPGTVALWLPLSMVGVRQRGFGVIGWAQFLAAPLIVAGFAVMLVAIGFFGVRGRGTPAPFDPPVHLVVRGPHRYVRNPMYLGVVVAVLGWALWFRSTTLVPYAAVAWLLFHLFVLLYEEPVLRRTFGVEYAAYCRSVRRWIPGRGYERD